MMQTSQHGRWVLAIILLGSAIVTTGGARADTTIILDRPVIVADPSQPSFVQYAMDDLTRYLAEISGVQVPITTSPETKGPSLIVVGPVAAERTLGAPLGAEELGDQGYVLKTISPGGVPIVIAAGPKPEGTKAAVIALMKRIQAKGHQVTLPSPLDLRSKPTFAKRGMHFNGWPFKYPHSFRRWREEDWKSYLDILAYQGVNLFYLWPFMEIMPLPLSPEDQAYLEECRRIVDYAQSKHGMEVWIMQCTNRVASDNCGVADPRSRPYWRPSQKDLDPGKPQDAEAIIASREVLYRAINNVDAVCNIDSDPGYCFNCPLEEYPQMLKAFRGLLDRCTLHGKQTRLMSWMWCGWGQPHEKFFELAHQERTLQMLKEQLPEPWGPVPGRFDFLDLCRKNGLLSKSILLPYGMIEDEPSYPQTNVKINGMRKTMDADFTKNLDLPGVIGNVQTPLLQLPHIYFFTSSLWDLDYRKTSEKDVLLELAGHLYPEHRPLVADCYLALKEKDPAKVASLADQLDELVRNDRLGRLGIIGRKLFPDHRVVAQAIVLQLRLRAAQERLFQNITPTTPQSEATALLRDTLDAYLAWDLTHGWHDLWGWTNIPLVPISADPRYPDLTKRLAQCLRTKPALDACLAEVAQALTVKYDSRIVQQGCIDPLSSTVMAMILNRAPWAKATASLVPDPDRYPPSAANDGRKSTQYWPGALVKDNQEWIQLTWDAPQRIAKVIVRFLQHPSMHGRTIHLQHEVSPGTWEDLATTTIPADAAAPYAVATFQLASPAAMDKIRIVNLLDVYEIEVY